MTHALVEVVRNSRNVVLIREYPIQKINLI